MKIILTETVKAILVPTFTFITMKEGAQLSSFAGKGYSFPVMIMCAIIGIGIFLINGIKWEKNKKSH